MAHREQEIFNAIVTAVTGLTTTGSNVYPHRVYDLPASNAAAIGVRLGPSVPTADDGYQNISFVDRLCVVYTRVHLKVTEASLDDQLLKVEREIWQAIMADRTLGLAFVIDTQPGGREESELDQAEKPTLACDIEWRVLYRHSLTDPGA